MSQEPAVSAETASAKARPRRTKRTETSTSSQLHQQPWQTLKNPYKPIEIIYDEQIEQIHNASMRILEEVGMDILDDDARALMAKCGAKVTAGSNRVYFDRHLIMDYIASVPELFTLHARNPAHNLQIGKISPILAQLLVHRTPAVWTAVDVQEIRRIPNFLR